MKVLQAAYQGRIQDRNQWPDENVIEVDKKSLHGIVEAISRSGDCRYPLLAIRILIYAITSVDGNGKTYISARQLSKSLDAHYDTVTKCLKYLRAIDVLELDRASG